MASVYTPQLSDSIDKPCLSCKTILIAKLPLQHIGESRPLSVTPERVKEILELVNIWLLKSTATLKELQSLIGKLSFIASCVHSSRIFIARLLNWLRSIPEKQSAQPVSSHITKDLMWWKRFLKVFNGISMMLLEDWSSPDEVFACDACISGCGGIMQTSYFHEQFPPGVTKLQLHINALELLTIVVALKVFWEILKGKESPDIF